MIGNDNNRLIENRDGESGRRIGTGNRDGGLGFFREIENRLLEMIGND